ncbi:hypothetical protein ATANTOWER_020738 [Ataeniobius toweri]|uniref:Uncharacterized protein n=1 Tax=Ataeniobius toweri TaxID=208326 RepID=A0ABU7BGR2_9TELE|nr:hypothetical protein [Ataeniobius toweri]
MSNPRSRHSDILGDEHVLLVSLQTCTLSHLSSENINLESKQALFCVGLCLLWLVSSPVTSSSWLRGLHSGNCIPYPHQCSICFCFDSLNCLFRNSSCQTEPIRSSEHEPFV